MSKVTRGFYDGYVASAYWSTSKLSKPTHYIGYVTLNDDDINKLKHFGSVLITCFSTDKLGDVYPCYQQDFTEIGFDLSKDKPIGKHPYGNELALVFEEDNAPPVQHDKNEQLAEKELAGDLPLDDSLVLSVGDLSLPQQGRREKQLAAILGVIGQLGLAPMKIPDGKKTKIESVCREQDKPYQLLFGDDGSTCFENAWKVGRKQKLFKMENNDSYAKRDK